MKRCINSGRNKKIRPGSKHDERLGLDLLRGRGKSIGGDLNVDDEGSE
jgi:hypothetical protein